MPDKVEGVSCGSTDHTPVTDMSKYGICAREGDPLEGDREAGSSQGCKDEPYRRTSLRYTV